MTDPETCSWCLLEWEWEDLSHVEETGENICPHCVKSEWDELAEYGGSSQYDMFQTFY